jgi:hypothetical protein
MFPTIVYRQNISLIIHRITIPVGQKFTSPVLAQVIFKSGWPSVPVVLKDVESLLAP